MRAVFEIYARAVGAGRAVPLLLLLPFVAELFQHAVEIRIGMYGPGGLAGAVAAPGRIAIGLTKVFALLVTIIFLLRWWRFEGDRTRVLRPAADFWKGLAVLILAQLTGLAILLATGRRALIIAGADASRAVRLAWQLGPLLLWYVVLAMLIPWFVALLTEDRATTLRRAFDEGRTRIPATFGLLLAGVVPLMAVHYALGYVAMGKPFAWVWALLMIDALIVAGLTFTIAATYFTLYRRAAARRKMVSS